MKIPRKHDNDDDYALFMLSHFIPFSVRSPLNLENGIWKCYEDAMTGGGSNIPQNPMHMFSSRAKEIMKNWDEIHECEDERDADRLRKRQRINKKMRAYAKTIHDQLPPEYFDNPDSISAIDTGVEAELDPQTAFMLASFMGANWLTPSSCSDGSSASETTCLAIGDPFAPFVDFKKRWQAQIERAAQDRAQARRAQLDPSKQLNSTAEPTSQILSFVTLRSLSEADQLPETHLVLSSSDSPSLTEGWETILGKIETDFQLNERQTWCFRICADRFRIIISTKSNRPYLNELSGLNASLKPLRFLMTGPGGTGKTYTIGTFQHLMARFGCAHLIRFLAPTGNTAVNLPNGQTIHKACGISVYDDSDSGRHALRLTVSLEKQGQLRDEWKNVEFLLVDEISLVGAQLLCDLDLILRCVREVDDWFGGINIIFAGDFFQLPPVQATPLYKPISKFTKKTGSDAQARERHGRIAWKQVDTVIELTEQKRMEHDKEFAEAVLRLRLHEPLTQDDVDLFNSRVIKSYENPDGVDLGGEEFKNMVAVVEYNKTRTALNSVKARQKTSGTEAPRLLACLARHTVSRDNAHQKLQDICLGTYHPKLPGELELYIGAPVILRVRHVFDLVDVFLTILHVLSRRIYVLSSTS